MYKGERFNSISHLTGMIAAIIFTTILLTIAIIKSDATKIVSFAIYGAFSILLFTVSTLYHSFSNPRAKHILQKLDHIAIYFKIAGTYTPFALLVLPAEWGLKILASVWGLAVLGVVQELFQKNDGKRILSLVIYLLMGWTIIFAIGPLMENLPMPGLVLLATGGLLYTVGTIFFVLEEKIPHGHGLWHLFVLAGSATHFACIVGYLT
ncbi:MAG: PAQR family membrane homeostasis protein TrhA [Bdellovibrionia bacterium]